MSTDTLTPSETTRSAAPAWMPPPPPGTGLTTAPAAQPVATQPVATQPAMAQPAAVQAPRQAPRPAVTERNAVPLGKRLLAGAIWGPVAMGVAALLQMWSSALGGDTAVRPLRLLTTVTGGGANLVDGPVLQGVLANVLLGITFGLLFAVVAPRLRSPRALLVGALVFGAGIFAVDLYLIATQLPLLELREDTLLLASRLVFGAILALGFLPSAPADDHA